MNYSYNYPAFNSSNGIGLEIYLSGCNRKEKCKGCHNPELWNFQYGRKLSLDELKKIIIPKQKYLDTFVIMGGEPLHQKRENLIALLDFLIQFDKQIWLYTSYEINEVPKEIQQYCNYIKTGRYNEKLKTKSNIQYGIQLASSNQKIYKMK